MPTTCTYTFPHYHLLIFVSHIISYCVPVGLTGTQVTAITVLAERYASSRSQDDCLNSSVSKQLARLNTSIHFALFTPHSSEMPPCPLNQTGWELLTQEYPDKLVIAALLGICQFGCRIGYEGSRQKLKIHANISTAPAEAHVVSSEIQIEQGKHRLKKYSSIVALPQHYTASPLGFIDKSDGTKRQIHHLFYPPADKSAINNGIPKEYGTTTSSSINEAISTIQDFGRNAVLVKRDFESAIRHIPISPLEAPLLGFHWEGAYYAEQCLPFGLRRAPDIFNLFAEVFH